MTVLAIGAGLFFAALVAHYAVWRISVPRSQLIALVLILLAVPVVRLLVLASPFGAGLLVHLPRFYIGLAFQLYAVISFAYLLLFDFIRRASPTSILMAEIEKNGQAGIGREQLLRTVTPRSAAKRLDQLQDDNLVVEGDGRLRLSPLGRVVEGWIPVVPQLLGRSRLPVPRRERA